MVTWGPSVVQQKLRYHRTCGAGAVHVWLRVSETATVLDACMECLLGPPLHDEAEPGVAGGSTLPAYKVIRRKDCRRTRAPGLESEGATQGRARPERIEVSCVGSESCVRMTEVNKGVRRCAEVCLI